ncbi:inositol oxygenase [Radiomyces spectabilis]|uniref:inositol oxygenase n=1 Tax=Radiomyces spectabilis TaxID=64574 RepID=UPI00221EBC78|nr:inositol oxygenase [Radiomyces spectabilis]KAI8372766.1 inositol oxygenase [Radiomyces spectabilis]
MRDLTNLQEAAQVTEAWEDYVRVKYTEKVKKDNSQFRDYEHAPTVVISFYKENHAKQSLSHVLSQKEKYGRLDKARMGIWEALEVLDTLVDESDPDTQMTQIMHALQSAEAARRDGQPRWMILCALIHDLGKYLYFLGEPQWTVVGDTYPVGCRFSSKIVYPRFFTANPDYGHKVYSTQFGIYTPHCGLQNVHLSYGHDEYLYQVCKDYLPQEALYIIRYHSFYSCHQEGEYTWLMDDQDLQMMKWVKIFNQYDLYSKDEIEPDVNALKPFYQKLISEYFPAEICW